MSSNNLVVYAWHLFQTDCPTPMPPVDQQLTSLQQSGFTTVIPWTIHVMENGDLVYNEVEPASVRENNTLVSDGRFRDDNFPDLPGLLAQLKSGTTSVTQVLFCIGSAVGDVDDFKNIEQLLSTPEGAATLSLNFAALLEAIPALDGFDFDNESSPLSDYTGTMATLAEILSATGKKITFCPYSDEPVWLASLQQIYALKHSQPVAWWNLQCYAGGAGNQPSQWVENFTGPTGVSNPGAYIIPGVAATTPEDVQTQIERIITDDPNVSGAFLWEASAVWQSPYSLADYASKMAAALPTRR